MDGGRFDGWTRRRAGLGLGGLAAGLLAVAGGGGAGAKKRKKGRCPKRCGDACGFEFFAPDGDGTFCGMGNTLQRAGTACVPCAREADCTSGSGTFPHCLNSFRIRASGEVRFFVDSCGPYELGVCGNVSACRL